MIITKGNYNSGECNQLWTSGHRDTMTRTGLWEPSCRQRTNGYINNQDAALVYGKRIGILRQSPSSHRSASEGRQTDFTPCGLHKGTHTAPTVDPSPTPGRGLFELFGTPRSCVLKPRLCDSQERLCRGHRRQTGACAAFEHTILTRVS